MAFEKKMLLWILIAGLLGCVLYVLCFYAVRQVVGEEEIDLGDADVKEIILSENQATFHYEWKDEMTATVPKNPCNQGFREFCK